MLERLVPLASPSHRTTLLDALTSDGETLFAVATSPYGSHLLEALVGEDVLQNDDDDDGRRLVDLIAQHIGDLVSHKYGSFFVRHVLRGGRREQGGQKKKGPNQQTGLTSLLALFERRDDAAHTPHIAHTFAAAVIQQPNLVDWPYHPYASPFCQALLCALGDDLWDALVLGVLGGPTEDSSAHKKDTKKKKSSSSKKKKKQPYLTTQQQQAAQDIMRDRAGSHFFEAVFRSATPATHATLCSSLLPSDQLQALAMHPHANFALQAALVTCEQQEGLTARALETLDVGGLLISQRGGVVVAMVLASSRNAEQYGAAMCAALAAPGKHLGGADNSKDSATQLAPLLHVLYLDRPNANALPALDDNPPPSTIGCALLQLVFTHFPQAQCQVFANALAMLPHAHLTALATHPGGVRVLESFLLGPASKKQRRTVLHALRDAWARIAMSGMAGSVFCEKCFTSVCTEGDVVSREAIVKVLAEKVNELQRKASGLLTALHVEAYVRDPYAWRRRQQEGGGGGKRAAAAFLDEIVEGGDRGDEGGALTKKKKGKKAKKEDALGGFVDMLSVGL